MSEKFLKIKAGNEIYTKDNIDNLFSETDVYLINENSSYQLSDVVKLLNSVAKKFGTKEYYSPHSWFWFSDIDDTTATLTLADSTKCVGTVIIPEKTEDEKYIVEFMKQRVEPPSPGDPSADSGTVFGYCELMTECVCPNSLTGIGDHTFSNCTGLSSIYLPNTVTRIDDYAFEYCSALKKINIPSSLTSLGEMSFAYCKELKSIQIPKSSSITEIKNGTFSYCGSLTEIGIPESVQSIGGQAFFGCSSLTGITLPQITSINGSVFGGCSSLSSIVIPDSVEYIEGLAFAQCTSLKDVTFSDNILSIGYTAFLSCHSLTNIELPQNLTFLGEMSFSNCSSLLDISFPNSLDFVNNGAFSYCISLTGVVLPDSITSIYSRAFYECSSITNLTFPSSLTYIGSQAFFGCDSLSLVIFEGKTLDEISSMENYPFGFSFNTKISCENAIFNVGDEENYISPYSWFAFRQESGNESEVSLVYANPEKCIGKIVIPTTTEDGKYVVNINGGQFADQRAFYMCDKITECILPSKLRIIGREAFSGLNIKELTIPESVNLNSIDYRAFYTSYLSSVTFEGKTMEQVQSASNYLAFGLSKDTQIICTDGTISYPGSV